MDTERHASHLACPWKERSELAAVAGTDDAEQRAAAAHLVECAECRTAYEAARRTVAALRALPVVAGRDITADVLAKLPREGAFDWRALARHPLLRAAAAVVAVGAGLALALRSGRQRPDAAPAPAPLVVDSGTSEDARRDAADWLAATQRPDGTWDVAALGGRAEHAPALTALALMALQDQDNPRYASALRKGAQALLAMQQDSGCFGDAGTSMMYNHGMATVALLRLQVAGAAGALRDPLDAAVAFIRSAQQAEGGWSYQPGARGGVANASVTAWQLEALGRARQAGWGDPQGHLRRGLFWLSKLADSHGVVGYQRPGDLPSAQVTTTAMGVYCLLQAGEGLDGSRDLVGKMARRLSKLIADAAPTSGPNPYRDFFASRASNACNAASLSPTARPDVASLRQRLVETRVAAGDLRGTWDPRDAYAQVGGRLYATSLSAMALR
jgi:hypothetical protein